VVLPNTAPNIRLSELRALGQDLRRLGRNHRHALSFCAEFDVLTGADIKRLLLAFVICRTSMAGTKDRIVKMEVLALGMPRTGTASMQAALRILGYSDVSHGFDLVYQPISSNAWEVAVDAKFYGKGPPCSREIFDAILGRCAAATDVPSSFFAEELLAAYPDVR
jgi:hypothetical protein